jgi:hypothetical protein
MLMTVIDYFLRYLFGFAVLLHIYNLVTYRWGKGKIISWIRRRVRPEARVPLYLSAVLVCLAVDVMLDLMNYHYLRMAFDAPIDFFILAVAIDDLFNGGDKPRKRHFRDKAKVKWAKYKPARQAARGLPQPT